MNTSYSYSSTLEGVLSAPQSLSSTLATPRADTPRCTWAIAYGNGWNTRCDHPDGHPRLHGGVGREDWPYEYVQWPYSDPKEYETIRDDVYAWWVDPLSVVLERSPGDVAT
jgi:hypothetical protein